MAVFNKMAAGVNTESTPQLTRGRLSIEREVTSLLLPTEYYPLMDWHGLSREPERVFSTTGGTITDKRILLSTTNVNIPTFTSPLFARMLDMPHQTRLPPGLRERKDKDEVDRQADRDGQSQQQVMKCKAAVAWAPKQPFVIEEIEVQPPKENEVRIKMVSTGICRSDDHAVEGILGEVDFPVILGHEGAGIVESVGKGVTNLKPGDKVIPIGLPQCGQCITCLNKHSNYCLQSHFTEPQNRMPDKTTRFTCKGKELNHFLWISTFSEYTVAPSVSVAKIDDRTPMEKACLFGCCFPTGYGGAVVDAKVEPGTTCAVFGLGAIGLAVIIGCKVSGASRIIAIDTNSSKFEVAKKLGATDCINPKELSKPIQEVIMEMTGYGVHYSFECVGNTEVMKAAVECTNQGYGVTMLIGVAPSGAKLSLDPLLFLTGRTVKGSIFGGLRGRDMIPPLTSDFVAGKFTLDSLVTHTMPFTNINEGFNLLRCGKSIRTVLLF
ncbi:alcohol dehydrogenase 1-like [Gastrophryne carolinensis]